MSRAYAVVPTSGRYGSGSIVRPVSRHRTLASATRAADRATRSYCAAMRPHGGSSGGYRVVAWRPEWLGWALDRVLDAAEESRS